MIRPTLLGLAGASIVAVRWFQLRRSVPPWTLAPAILCVVYVFFRAWIFGRHSAGSWYTLDLYTLYADLSFGFNPSMWCNRWVERFGLYPMVSVVYESLVLAIAATYALSLGRRGQPVRVLAVMMLAGIVGIEAYRLLPACGPAYLLGSECFLGEVPASCAKVTAADLRPVALNPAFPRNAMPSLHIGWALLVYWMCGTLRWRWRWVALAYLIITALATLAGGEHYLVDLVAAFPFSLAIWAICCPLQWSPERVLTIFGSALGLLLWIAVIRFYPRLLWSSVVTPWLLSAILVGGAIYCFGRLSKMQSTRATL
ncbi:MAG: phosphatase PAP2 family protein [Candidatus Sulfotelmatobacter sp.]